MIIPQKMQEAINRQINNEFYSSYLYLSMSAYFKSVNLHGFSHWMKMQAKEELAHAVKLFDYIHSRGGRVTLMSIEKPTVEWSSALEAIEHAYKHEQQITELINSLVAAARTENDTATSVFLNWFVTEQTEEEAQADELLQKVKLLGSTNIGLFMIDRELGQRK